LPEAGSLIKLYQRNFSTFNASLRPLSAASFYVSGFLTWYCSNLMCSQLIRLQMKSTI